MQSPLPSSTEAIEAFEAFFRSNPTPEAVEKSQAHMNRIVAIKSEIAEENIIAKKWKETTRSFKGADDEELSSIENHYYLQKHSYNIRRLKAEVYAEINAISELARAKPETKAETVESKIETADRVVETVESDETDERKDDQVLGWPSISYLHVETWWRRGVINSMDAALSVLREADVYTDSESLNSDLEEYLFGYGNTPSHLHDYIGDIIKTFSRNAEKSLIDGANKEIIKIAVDKASATMRDSLCKIITDLFESRLQYELQPQDNLDQ